VEQKKGDGRRRAELEGKERPMTQGANLFGMGSGAIGRRRFMAGAAAASLSALYAKRARAAGPKIRLGMIGCGMRGQWIAPLFVQHGGYELVGAADYFQDRVDEFGEKFGVPPSHRHTNLSGYTRLLDRGVDAVVIESPPWFHPEQAATAVEAGAHVFLAKPIAVDVPGALRVERLGEEAAARGLTFLVDFQTRTSRVFKEAVARVHRGDIGAPGLGDASFNGGDVWNNWNNIGRYLEPGSSDPEARLRGWGFDRALSGGILVEQCIHSIDVASWILDAAPLTAAGVGARKHYERGDVWDVFAVTYRFPGDMPVLVSANQFGHGFSRMGCRVQGTSGTIDTNYEGDVTIRGEKPWEGGSTSGLYEEGAFSNIVHFHDSITAGRSDNDTVAPSVRSHLAAMLGTRAAWAKQEMAWDEMIAAAEPLECDLVARLKS
jgi:predicted dehydrogenase